MNCKNCHLPIINTVNHINLKNKYIGLFRKLFPRKPIEINYCTSCYGLISDELELEYNSQIEQLNSYNDELANLKNKTHQSYSITDGKDFTTTHRYQILSESSEEYKNIKKRFEETLSFKIIRIEKNNNPML